MRNRSLYFLTELLLVLLLFAASLAVCLGIQEKSLALTEESAQKTKAVFMAQSAAETWKGEKDPASLAALLDGRAEGECIIFEAEGLRGCLTQYTAEPLAEAHIEIFAGEELLYALPLKQWQGGGTQ